MVSTRTIAGTSTPWPAAPPSLARCCDMTVVLALTREGRRQPSSPNAASAVPNLRWNGERLRLVARLRLRGVRGPAPLRGAAFARSQAGPHAGAWLTAIPRDPHVRQSRDTPFAQEGWRARSCEARRLQWHTPLGGHLAHQAAVQVHGASGSGSRNRRRRRTRKCALWSVTSSYILMGG